LVCSASARATSRAARWFKGRTLLTDMQRLPLRKGNPQR